MKTHREFADWLRIRFCNTEDHILNDVIRFASDGIAPEGRLVDAEEITPIPIPPPQDETECKERTS